MFVIRLPLRTAENFPEKELFLLNIVKFQLEKCAECVILTAEGQVS
jgi:hypothetical protein